MGARLESPVLAQGSARAFADADRFQRVASLSGMFGAPVMDWHPWLLKRALSTACLTSDVRPLGPCCGLASGWPHRCVF